MPQSMALLHYVGDEIAAAGWRLAGAAVHVPAAGDEAAALSAARAAARATGALVLVSAATAARIDAVLVQGAVAAPAPLVLVIPDTQGQVAMPDFAARLRTQLGLDEGQPERLAT